MKQRGIQNLWGQSEGGFLFRGHDCADREQSWRSNAADERQGRA